MAVVKAGGVKLAKSPEEAYEHAKAILGMDIKGHTVHRVLVADSADIAEEYYFSSCWTMQTAPTWRTAR